MCGFEHNIHHHLIKPRTPQLDGKIERFHLNLREEADMNSWSNLSTEEIQRKMDEHLTWYNTKRPYFSLKFLTPHEKFYKSMKVA